MSVKGVPIIAPAPPGCPTRDTTVFALNRNTAQIAEITTVHKDHLQATLELASAVRLLTSTVKRLIQMLETSDETKFDGLH